MRHVYLSSVQDILFTTFISKVIPLQTQCGPEGG